MKDVAILGAGGWGTALAVHLGRAGREVHLWARDPGLADDADQLDRALGHGALEDPDEPRGEVDLMGVGVTQLEVELAERLVAHVPSVERVVLTVTGSEATFHALRLARATTGRRRVLKFQGCYHGWHDSVAMNVISVVGTRAMKSLRS